MKALLRSGLFLLLILAVQSVWASPRERIGILQVANISGVRQGDLERRAEQALIKLLGETGANVVSSKKVSAHLKKLKLQEVQDYLPLLSDGEIAKLCQRIGVDRLVTLQIMGYNEFVRNKVRTFEIKLSLDVYASQQDRSQVYPGAASGEKSLDWVVNAAVRQSLDKLYGRSRLAEVDTSSVRADDAPVVVNQTSGQYHLTSAHHLPKADRRQDYPTRRQAERDGYSPCMICFPGFDSYHDADLRLERELGAWSARIMESNYRIAHHPEKLARVRRVANTIIPVTGRKNVQYRFYLLDTNEINAFSLPGGLIYVTLGLLQVMEDDDELAFVLAHEMVHNVRKHAIAQYRLTLGMQFLTLILLIGDEDHRGRDYYLANLLHGIIQSGYSRGQEREADRLGLVYALGSKHAPRAYQSVFGKFIDMKSRDPHLVEKMFSSHPSPEERTRLLDDYLEGLKRFKAELAN
jgi:hypothetical protein